MIILSWNMRGIGAKIKRSTLRKLIVKHNPHFVFIQESKKESLDPRTVNSIWKQANVQFTFSPSSGNSGGLISLWDASFFSLESSIVEKNWIALNGSFPSINFKGVVFNIYSPCTVEERASLYEDIVAYWESLNVPCLLIGDFNETLSPLDRGSQYVDTNGSESFKAFLQGLQVTEIPSSNGWFTWFRNQSKSKIDRLFVHPQWISHIPAIKLSILNRSISDHCPLLVTNHDDNWGPRPFRFQDCWLSHPGCMRTIKEAWLNSDGLFPDKLRKVRTELREWNKTTFGSIDENIAAMERKISELDSTANLRPLDQNELNDRRQAQTDLWQWLRRRETYWAQNSRNRWLREGDKNTKFFHATATMRRRRNTIEKISVNGVTTNEPDDIRTAAEAYFKHIFEEPFEDRPTFDGLNFKTLTHEQQAALISEFSTDEIEEAVKSCDGSKAPGPDGFNFKFIHSAWEVIKNDIFGIVNDFWQSARLPKGSNTAFIALIPKLDNPQSFKDFRPISMVGCTYKIISKLLARRLQKVINELISHHQTSFIRGRQILDGALIASELIDSCRRNNTQASILKIDFHKAFDSVSWKFLDWVLQQMHFPEKWRLWMNSCVMKASASILINGSPTMPVKLQRGLRQGDPLSPFLFDIVAESLGLLIQKATSMQLWEGLDVCANGQKLTHLQYADDTILFCPPQIEQLLNVKKMLVLFHQASGLKVNFHKSSILGIHITDSHLQHLASSLLCKQGRFPFVYLGLPIGGNMSRIEMWNPIIDRISKKLASWKGSLLSIGGRLTLIKASLASLPLYYLSLFPAPKGVLHKIIQLQRQFLWSGYNGKKSLPLVAWNILELPKKLGGVNIGNLQFRNLGLLFRWVWRLVNEPSSLWQQLVRSKYQYGPYFSPLDLKIPLHGGPWKALCASLLKHPQTNSLIMQGIRKKVGNGSSSLFWHDCWVGENPLKLYCPRLFLLSTSPNATIASLGFWDGLSWKWTLSWKRDLRTRDRHEECTLQLLLDGVVMNPRMEDAFIWTPHKSGEFSIKSFTTELAEKSQLQGGKYFKGLWQNLVPHRIELFTWFALLGKINTKAKLISMGIIPSSSHLCVLCGSMAETCEHLLLHCPLSWMLWCWWFKIWQVHIVIPSSLSDLYFLWHPPPLKGNFFKKVWRAIFHIILWTIWKERNSRIFDNISSSIQQLQDLILIRMSWWIKGWGDPFPYSAQEIVSNPECLAWAENRNLLPKMQNHKNPIMWSPPPIHAMKWNVDASFHPSCHHAAIGGVLRDHLGRFVCVFSSPIPLMEINMAEVHAIHRALKLTLGCSRFEPSHLIIESDSINAVRWCMEGKAGPWNLNFTLNFIKNALRSSPNLSISIIHKKRESNVIADAFAKQGLRRSDEFVAWL